MNLLTGDNARAMGCNTYGIRPEHLTTSRTEGLWQARIRHIEHLGADAILHCDAGPVGTLIARTHGDTDLTQGATVWLTPIAEKEHRFGG